MRMTTVLGLAAATVLGGAAAAAAIERTTVPAFVLTDMAGQTIASDQLTRTENWLLVYVGSDCAACDAVLSTVDQDDAGSLPAKMTIVMIATDPAEIALAARRFPALAGASWYAVNAGAASALRVTAVPALFGVRGGTIEWSVAGVLDRTEIKAIMSSWVR